VGDGGTRGELGAAAALGPRAGSGDACLKEGDGECRDGEPEERVDALNGLSGLSCGRRIGRGPGTDGRSYKRESEKGARDTWTKHSQNPCFPFSVSHLLQATRAPLGVTKQKIDQR
jgi:hypothetical protein